MKKIKIILMLTFMIFLITGCVNKIDKDTMKPTVIFSLNGNQIYAKTYSSKVTVSDNNKLEANSLKYQWTTSNIAPTEASFTMSFINEEQISTPANVTGMYYLWISAKDKSGNSTIIKSAVFNLDNTLPVISIVGNKKVMIHTGTLYKDAGATASDNIDGNITIKIQINSNVNYKKAGIYEVKYIVSDLASNTTIPVTRTVMVVDAVSMPTGR